MLPGKVMPCFPVFEDNQGAVQLAQNPATHSNSKYIDVRHHFLRNKSRGARISKHSRRATFREKLAEVTSEHLCESYHQNKTNRNSSR